MCKEGLVICQSINQGHNDCRLDQYVSDGGETGTPPLLPSWFLELTAELICS